MTIAIVPVEVIDSSLCFLHQTVVFIPFRLFSDLFDCI